MKVASAQPLPGVDPACSSTPGSLRCLVGRVAAIELTAFEHISRRAIPRHLLGLERLPDFFKSTQDDELLDLRVEFWVSPKVSNDILEDSDDILEDVFTYCLE